jgi:xanthine dehydrogenase YagS FAD-binding subunit
MKAFAYAQPSTEAEVLQFLSDQPGEAEIIAGGTDLVGLMKKMIITPERVVNIMEVPSLKRIDALPDGGVRIGAAVTLDDVNDSALLAQYPAVKQAITSLGSIQLQCQGTIGGDLCQRPRCWYFRSGNGTLAQSGKLVVEGDNRNHAIFGNDGPAKFVSGTRLGPALIAHQAKVRVLGPSADDEALVGLASFFQSPRHEGERETILRRDQFVSHILLPPNSGWTSAIYEVKHGVGPDYPLAAAAAALQLRGGVVEQARIILGQVAPTPWMSDAACHAIEGMPVNATTAEVAGRAAIEFATPLKDNAYKVQLAKTAVQRAVLRAAGLPTGGMDDVF